ncbi:hypothetical protein GW17_00061779, partial [Ensete ventricosum]
TLCKVTLNVEFQLIFRELSWNFKILAIPHELAHGKSYEHGFVKKCDGDKFCTKSHFDCFDRFFVNRLEFQNTDNSQCISPWEVLRA